MTMPSYRTSRMRQRGLSLVELIVAMALGTVLVAGAAQIFISNSQAFRLQQNVSSAQEAGRLALEIILADLRRAGSGGVPNAVVAVNNGTPVASAEGLLTPSDSVQVSYVTMENTTDCEGHPAFSGDTITNRYRVGQDSDPNIAALFCSGQVNGAPAMGAGVALLRGVESFQVLYGVGQDALPGNGVRTAVRYVPAGSMGGVSTPVAVIRVGMLVRSEAGIAGLQAPSSDLPVLDTTITQATLAGVTLNGRFPVHRFFTGTAILRNDAAGIL